MNKKIIIWFLISIIVLGGAGEGAWYYSTRVNSSIADSSTITPAATLTKASKSFSKAQTLKRAGSYTLALAAYKAALPAAKTPPQKALVEYNIANMASHTGDPIAAIKTLQQIAANTAYSPQRRAQAVEKMGRLFHSTFNPAITQEIFKVAPFTAMSVPGNTLLSYRNLFEYGAHLYPRVTTELYIANMYAQSIGTLYKKGATATSTAVVSDMKAIEQRFNAAGTGLSSTSPSNSHMPMSAFASLRKAITLANLSYLGLASPAYAQTTFKLALSFYDPTRTSTNGSTASAKVRYQYASFLAHTYGNTKTVEIQKLLQPLYTGTQYSKSSIADFFKNARGSLGVQVGTKANLQLLAQIDSGFKTYLTSLGWSASDFTQ